MLKKMTAMILSVAMLVTGMGFSVNAQEVNSMNNIVYVSPDGRLNATGSYTDPFSSIEEARDYLRKNGALSSDNRGVVYLREGEYRINKSIEFTAEDSFVTYMAYADESVEITGVASLPKSGFKKLSDVTGEKYSSQSRIKADIRDKVYVFDLDSHSIPAGEIYKNGFNWTKKPLRPELAQNGELLTLAQYPDNGTYLNTGNLGIHSQGGTPRNYFFDKTDDVKTYEEMLCMNGPVFSVKNLPSTASMWAGGYPSTGGYSNVNGDMDDENPLSDNTKYETDGWLSGYFANEYANDNLKMYSERLSNGTYYIYCKYPSIYAVNNSLKVEAINLLCEMDTEGEYYIDRYNGNNILYYYPKNEDLDNITLTSMDVPHVTINSAEELYIRGIKFTGTTSYGIKMDDCESCLIEDCELYNISMDAIRIGNDNGMITCDSAYDTFGGGHNNIVENCVIHDMGHGGVYVAGGERKSLERGNNVVRHCEFYNFSRLATYTPAVYLEGVGNVAENNYIHDAPHMVIQIMGNDMLVKGNRIINACYNANDMAPIYLGRDWTWLGNEISYNYIEDVRYSDATDFNFGVYMDDNVSGTIIKNNIFNKVGGNGVYLNQGYGSYVVDNIFLDSTGPYFRYYTSSNRNWARPIPNEKSLKYRFYDMLRTEEEAIASGDEAYAAKKGYWNNEENIAYWVEHYNKLYNGLEEFSKNPEYAFDLSKMHFPKEGDNTSSVWLDKFAVINQNHNTIVRNITANTKDLMMKGNFYNGINMSDPETFDIKRHRAGSAAELDIDLSTGQIGNNSSLMNDINYGSEWIDKWNSTYTIEIAGLKRKTDKAKLFAKIGEAERVENKSASLESALLNAHKIASDADSSEYEVDKAYEKLFKELSKISEQYELNLYNATLCLGETLKLNIAGDGEANVLWYTSDEAVAIVNRDGVVYPIAEGKCKITACVDGKSFVCNVVVEGVEEDKKIVPDISTVKKTSEESNNKAQYVFDGNMNTRWSSASVVNNPYPQWVEVDLGAEYDIGRADISFYYTGSAKDKDRAYDYELMAKSESGDWVTILNMRDNTDKTSNVTLEIPTKNKARYFKLIAYGCDKGGLAAVSIYEITLWQRMETVSYKSFLEKEVGAAQQIDKEACDKALLEGLDKALVEAEDALAANAEEEMLKERYNALRSEMLKIEKRVDYLVCGNNMISLFETAGFDGRLICAVYSEKTLKSVATYDVATGTEEYFSVPMPKMNAGDALKIMLWNDLSTFEPIKEYMI